MRSVTHVGELNECSLDIINQIGIVEFRNRLY
jgi:hypothetical protein